MLRFATRLGCAVSLVVLLFTTTTSAQSIDPRGIYFMRAHQNGSPTSFTEWFTVIPLPQANRYMLRDFFGYGWNGTITPAGVVVIDGAAQGSFSDADHFIAPTGPSPSNTYNNSRCAGTTIASPMLLPNTPVAGNPARSGIYQNTTLRLNPETSGVLSTVEEDLTLTVTANRLRITLPNNLFYDGVFVADDHVIFRVVQNTVTGWLAQFASYPGTTTNSARDIMGELFFTDAHSFTATIARQTRAAIGSQSQDLYTFTGSRGGNQVPSDLNQDTALDIADATSLLQFLFVGGSTITLPCGAELTDAGNVAILDMNGDATVNLADAISLLGYLFGGGTAPVLGTSCLPIIGCDDGGCSP